MKKALINDFWQPETSRFTPVTATVVMKNRGRAERVLYGVKRVYLIGEFSGDELR